MKTHLRDRGDARWVLRMPSEWTGPAQYAFALGMVVLSLLVRWLLVDVLQIQMPFALTLGVLLPLVLLVRPGPFLGAVVLGWLGTLYLFVPPVMGLGIAGAEEAVMVAIYTGVLAPTALAAWLSRRAMDARERDTAALRASAEREHRLAEEARAAEAKFRSIFHQSGIFAGIMDLDGTVREANDLCLSACGYRAEEVIGRLFWETPWWRGSEEVKAKIRAATARAAAGDVFRETLPYWRSDGTERVVDFALHPIRDEKGRVMCLHPTGIDMTDRERAEEQLRRNHETFFNLIQNTPFGIYIVDAQFRLRQVSAGAQKVFQNVRPLIDRDFAEVLRCIWEEPFASEAIARFRQTLESGEPYVARDTTEHRHDVGEVESYDWRIERITLPDGQFGVVCYFYDLSEIKRVEEKLRHRSEQFETLLNAAPLGVYFVDADFRVAQVNPIAAPVFKSVPDLIGRDFAEVLHILWEKNYAEEVVRIFRHTLETGQSHHTPELAKYRADRGVIEYYEWRVDRIKLSDGRYGAVCYFRDISEQVRARQAIAESEARYRTLFESIDEGFCILDLIFDDGDRPIDFRFVEMNPSFERQTGVKEARGRTVRELVPDIEDFWSEIFGKVAITGEPNRFVEQARSLGRWFDIYAFRIGEPQERKVAVLFSNITDRKVAELALAEAREELKRHADDLEQTVAERTERLRETVAELEHFSYTITHDMRAPLRTMQAFGQILREDYHSRLDEQGADFLRRIIESANRMDRLITDSLNYAKTVQTEFVLEPLDPGKLLRGMIESYPQFQPPRGEIEMAKDFPLVLANLAGLTQCFSNLLGNAIKFVEAGKTPRVRVWAEVCGDRVRLWFQDNGIGIPPDQQERVFVMFQRLSKDFEGTGVGLALVRKVVERMRGKVGIASGAGGGSLFWVELQRAQPKTHPRGSRISCGGERSSLSQSGSD